MTTHQETRDLPFTADQMFALVADVEAYPKFLPWNAAARIRSRVPIEGGERLEADLVISFKVFRERFGSVVRLLPGARRIETEYLDGPFRHMRSHWVFVPTATGCHVEFFVDFEFRNAILQKLIGLFFHEAMQRVVRAFEARAQALYGAAQARDSSSSA